MPDFGSYYLSPLQFRRIAAQREAYRQKLIAKGVMNGSRKMMKLMARKFR